MGNPTASTSSSCEKCGSEPGRPYTFLYGNSESHQTGTNTYRTQYAIKGLHTMHLGDRCVGRRKVRTRIWLGVSLAIVLVAGLMLLFGVESGEQTMVYGVPIFVVFMGGIAALLSAIVAGIMLAVYRDPVKAGTDEAEKLGKREMKGRGFNFTTSPEGWASLKARERWGGNLPNRNAELKEYRALVGVYEAKVKALVEQAHASGQPDVAAFQDLGKSDSR
jgi:NADH:ubiquinone oxidoreductase subunit K